MSAISAEDERVRANQEAGAAHVDAVNGFASEDAPSDLHQGPVVEGELATPHDAPQNTPVASDIEDTADEVAQPEEV